MTQPNGYSPAPSNGTPTIFPTAYAEAVNVEIVALWGIDSFKNRIINGDMRIDQRFEGASKTITVHPTYTLDRWGAAAQAASKFSVQRVADGPAGFINSLKVTSLSAYTAGAAEEFGIYQQIVGHNMADMGFGTANAVSVAISFWVKSSLTGTFAGRIKNNGSNRSYIFNYAISIANTWEQKTVIIAGDTTGTWTTDKTIGLQLFFDLGGGSNYAGTAGSWQSADLNHTAGSVAVVATNAATWQLTGVQLERGLAVTAFQHRPREVEERMCFYYYQKSFDQGVAPAQNAGTSKGEFALITQGTGTFGLPLIMPVKMRSNFTLTTYNPSAANANWRDLSGSADRTFTGAALGPGSAALYGSGSSANADTRIHWTAESEL
jgi:hypothetical protein